MKLYKVEVIFSPEKNVFLIIESNFYILLILKSDFLFINFFLEQVKRIGAFFFRIKIFIETFNGLFFTGLSNSEAKTNFEDVSSLAGNVEGVRIGNVQILS